MIEDDLIPYLNRMFENKMIAMVKEDYILKYFHAALLAPFLVSWDFFILNFVFKAKQL